MNQGIHRGVSLVPDEWPQWVCWRYGPPRKNGKRPKIPYNPHTGTAADVSNPETWGAHHEAADTFLKGGYDGIGFVFSESDPFTGIDLDGCRNSQTGEIEEWALNIVRELNTYSEVSPSGTGVHCIVAGKLPGPGNRVGNVEVYDHNRYFTWSGKALSGSPHTVEPRQEALEAIHRRFITKKEDRPRGNLEGVFQQGHRQHSDGDLLRMAQDSPINGSKFRGLWGGDIAGYASESEATLAMLNMLAYWTGKDAGRMDVLFRQSGLMRPKWDEKRGRSTWGAEQIQKAISGTMESFGDRPRHMETGKVTGGPSPDPVEPEPLFPLEEGRVGTWLDISPPPRRWLVNNVLPIGKTGLLVAPGGTGKSLFMIQLALATATGLPLFGKLPMGETGGVLALFAEDDGEELHRRFFHTTRNLLEWREEAETCLGQIRERIIARSMVGMDNLITAKFREEVIRTEYADRLLKTADGIPDLKLILIDPASRFKGGEENAAADATRFVEAMEYISQRTWATVLVAHHANKSSMVVGGTSQAAARGSSALTDGVRWQANLSTMTVQECAETGTHPGKRKNFVRFSIPKNNYAPPFEDRWLMRGEYGILQMVDLTPPKAVENDAIMERVTSILQERSGSGHEYGKRAFVERFGGVKGDLECGEKRLRRIIEEALENGALIERPPATPSRGVRSVLALPDGERDPQGGGEK